MALMTTSTRMGSRGGEISVVTHRVGNRGQWFRDSLASETGKSPMITVFERSVRAPRREEKRS